MTGPLSDAQMGVVEHGLVQHDPDPNVTIVVKQRDQGSYYAMKDIAVEARDLPISTTSQGYCEAYFCTENSKWYAVRITNGGGHGSVPYDTQQEAERDLRMSVAQTRQFWKHYASRVPLGVTTKGERIIRCDGQHYVVDKAYRGAGFGGSLFVFELLDTGERVETRNLWSQGRIPDDFRDWLPDNARNITPEPPPLFPPRKET